MTLEDLHSHANPQLVCNTNNLFSMHHDNKAPETREATFVASTVRPAAPSVKVDMEDAHDKCQQRCRNYGH